MSNSGVQSARETISIEVLPKTEAATEQWLGGLMAAAAWQPEAFGTATGMTSDQQAEARRYLFAGEHDYTLLPRCD